MKSFPNRSTPRYLAFVELMRSTDALWNASRLFLARWELSPSQFNLLNVLSSFAEGCSQMELSRQLIMHRSNVTGLVDRLAARGYVQRHDDPKDRRVFVVVLTPAGINLLKSIWPAYYQAAEEIWGDSSTETVQATVTTLSEACVNAARIARSQEDRSH